MSNRNNQGNKNPESGHRYVNFLSKQKRTTQPKEQSQEQKRKEQMVEKLPNQN